MIQIFGIYDAIKTAKPFVLSGILIVYFYFTPVVLARGGSESLFVSVNKPEYAAFSEISLMKVKVFEYQSGYLDGLKKIEAEMNDFLSQKHKIEQIFQTSAGAGAGNGYKIFTIITVFYKE